MFALFLNHREHREKIEDTEVFLKSLCPLWFIYSYLWVPLKEHGRLRGLRELRGKITAGH